MAEGFLRDMAGDSFEAVSVGIDSAAPSPRAAQVMKEVGIDITKQKSKTVQESLNEHFGYVVSIADTSRERSPVFPSTPNLLKWNEVDPAVVLAGDSDRTRERAQPLHAQPQRDGGC